MDEEMIEELKEKYGYDEMTDDEKGSFEKKIFQMIYGSKNENNKPKDDYSESIDKIDDIEHRPRFM